MSGGPQQPVDTAATRDAAAVRIFPPGVPLLTVAAGVLLDRLWPIDPGFTLPRIVRYGLGGVLVAGPFCALLLWAFALFHKTGQDPKPWLPSPALVERGPFRVTRNPMYLCMVLGCIGVAILFANVWILILTPLCVWLLQRYAIVPEEAYLERKFGEAYVAYKRRVRRWL